MEELEAAGMQAFDDSRLTKFITIGRPTAICFQLCTQCGVAICKQVKIPEKGETGVLLLPARKRADRVDIPEGINQGWQSSAWPPAAAATENKTGVTEVVLKGVTQEADGKRHEVVLFTDQATGCQTVRMRFCTGELTEKAEKERLTAMNAQTGEADVWKREDLARQGQEEQAEPAPTTREKDRRKQRPKGKGVPRGGNLSQEYTSHI